MRVLQDVGIGLEEGSGVGCRYITNSMGSELRKDTVRKHWHCDAHMWQSFLQALYFSWPYRVAVYFYIGWRLAADGLGLFCIFKHSRKHAIQRTCPCEISVCLADSVNTVVFVHNSYCLSSKVFFTAAIIFRKAFGSAQPFTPASMKNRTVPDSWASSILSTANARCSVIKTCNHWPIRLQRRLGMGTRAAAKHHDGKYGGITQLACVGGVKPILFSIGA